MCLFASCQKDNDIVDELKPEPEKAVIKYAEYETTDDYVDFGTGNFMIATKNLGAKRPEDTGDFFAWGETEPKEDYSWSTYKWCNGDKNKLTKYCTKSSYWDSTEPVDNKTTLDPEDDAAHVIWSGSWRMPTDAEWTELRKNCTWTWTTQNGVNGQLVASKTNGNSIFLPAAGRRLDKNLYYVGSSGFYWSSSLYTVSQYGAYAFDFYSGGVSQIHYSRYCGYSVRPVSE